MSELNPKELPKGYSTWVAVYKKIEQEEHIDHMDLDQFVDFVYDHERREVKHYTIGVIKARAFEEINNLLPQNIDTLVYEKNLYLGRLTSSHFPITQEIVNEDFTYNLIDNLLKLLRNKQI